MLEAVDFKAESFAGMLRARLAADPAYTAVRTIPGSAPVLGAIFVAEIGDIARFAAAPQLACWAGLTP